MIVEMTTTTKANRISHKQIVEKADATLAATQREQAEVQADLESATAEIVALEKRVAQREDEMAARRRKVEELREQFLENTAYEAFAVNGIAAEQSQTLMAQEAFLRTEEAVLTSLEEQAATEEAVDTEQLIALRALKTDRERRLAELHHQREITEQVKRQAIQRAGDEVYEQVVAQLGLLQAAYQERLDDVKLAEEKIGTFAANALQQLAEFPDFLPQLGQVLPVRDAVTNVLEAEIVYIEAMLYEGKKLPSDLALPNTYENLWSLLVIPAPEIYTHEHLTDQPMRLRCRLEYVQRLLSYYREECARRTA